MDEFWMRKLLIQITRLLHETYPLSGEDYHRRGDIVYLEHELKLRNMGKYFYDGSNVIVPSTHKYTLSVPLTFQVIIEFPINYWERRLIGTYFIPFVFHRYFPDISIDEIKVKDPVPYFTFILEDNDKKEVYTIYATIYIATGGRMVIPTREEFFDKLRNATYFVNSTALIYFQYIKSRHSPDPDHTLFL